MVQTPIAATRGRRRSAPSGLAALAVAALLATGCSDSSGAIDSGAATTVDATSTSTDSASTSGADTTTSQTSAEIPESTTSITLDDSELVITEGGAYTLTGDSSAAVVVTTADDVTIVLDGVNIVSETGAAIVVEEAGNVSVILADGSENHVEDAPTREDAEVNGTIYSTADLAISGTGSLDVTANYEDGIVTKDDLEILSGTITVDAVDEGIRGRDSITMAGGDIDISAGGDGFKTTNAESLDTGYIRIEGGTLTIDAGDDAIKAATTVEIADGTIEVVSSREGIEAINITIDGGDITVNAEDDGINAVAGNIAGDVFIAVTGGVVDVTVGSGDTDAFDSNGSISVSGGDITVTAPTSSFDYDSSAEMTGGTITVNGEQLSSIPAGMGGGPRGGAPGR